VPTPVEHIAMNGRKEAAKPSGPEQASPLLVTVVAALARPRRRGERVIPTHFRKWPDREIITAEIDVCYLR
jgi:hypothetical protein